MSDRSHQVQTNYFFTRKLLAAILCGALGTLLIVLLLIFVLVSPDNQTRKYTYELLYRYSLDESQILVEQYCKDGKIKYLDINVPQRYICATGGKIVIRQQDASLGIIHEEEIGSRPVMLLPAKEEETSSGRRRVFINIADTLSITGDWRAPAYRNFVKGVLEYHPVDDMYEYSYSYRQLEHFPRWEELIWNEDGTKALLKGDLEDGTEGRGCRPVYLMGYDLLNDKQEALTYTTKQQVESSMLCAKTLQYLGECDYWDPYWKNGKAVAQVRDACGANGTKILKTGLSYPSSETW